MAAILADLVSGLGPLGTAMHLLNGVAAGYAITDMYTSRDEASAPDPPATVPPDFPTEPVTVYPRDFIGPLPSAEWYADRKYEPFKGRWPGVPHSVRMSTVVKAFKKAASKKKVTRASTTLKTHPNSRAYRRFLKANKGKKGKAREKWTSKAVKAKYGYKAV